MYNNGDYFFIQNNFLYFCIYVTNVCSAFILSPTKIQGFWYLAGLWSCETHKNTLNTAKLARNLITYLSIQYIWNLSWLLGLCSCCKLANLSRNFITATSNIKHARVISAKFIDFLWNLPRKFLQNQSFFTDWFSVTLALKIPTKSANFPWICLWKSCEIWLFFPATY